MSGIANRVVREADGALTCPECGCFLSDTRSFEMHRMYFAFNKFVFDNWPEHGSAGAERFIPDNPEHGRAWLLIKAGHVQPSHVFRFATRQERQWCAGFLTEQMRADRARGVYGWPQERDGGIAVIYPASISIYGSQALSQKAFNKVAEAVFKVVQDETGIDFDTWKSSRGNRR